MNIKRVAFLSVTALAMVLMILDTETALHAANDGVEICLRTIIPSLFPFFFLSAIINSALIGTNLPILRPLSRICRIPMGTESLLILGLIGGYPVGASAIHASFATGEISRRTAQRMLAFCNNAGPAFIFGIMSVLFENKLACWVLWAIHIGSAILVSLFLPADEEDGCIQKEAKTLTATQGLQTALKNTASVCGWVVLFRIAIGFMQRWFLWLFPPAIQVLICGLLELSNGCISLSTIPAMGLRFIFASVFLAFGGICVTMQSSSVVGSLAIKSYCLGKIMQTALSLLFSAILQGFLFPESTIKLPVFLYLPGIIVFLFPVLKNAVAFPKTVRYNRLKSPE